GNRVINPTRVTNAITRATSDINDYAGQQYSATSMAAHPTINSWCAWLACYYLSRSRGNPPPEEYAIEKDEIHRKLQLIANQQYKLNDCALRADMRPTMSNLTVDRRFRQTKVRVLKSISTSQPTTLQQNTENDIAAGNT